MKKIAALLVAYFVLLMPSAFAQQTVNMADYWPNPAVGEQLLVQHAVYGGAPDNLAVLSRFRRGGSVNGFPVIQLDDYISTGWLDAWEYRFDPTHGVIEVANKFPGKRQVYKNLKWIPWGGIVSIPSSFGQSIEVDVPNSTGVSVGPSNYGYQGITFHEVLPTFTNLGGMTFSNVVRMSVLQSWCNTWTCTYPSQQTVYNMDYWIAPGVGIIQTTWPGIGSHYARSITRTVAMPLS